MPRNYAKEYKTYHGKPEQIMRRDARNKARAIMVNKGVVRRGDGLHIDHTKITHETIALLRPMFAWELAE